jgi:hypothetical protein
MYGNEILDTASHTPEGTYFVTAILVPTCYVFDCVSTEVGL